MNFEILTLFPQFFTSFFRTSLMKRAIISGLVTYHLIQIRKYGKGRYRKVDDMPFGGKQGSFSGMLLKPDVLSDAHAATKGASGGHTILLSPRGKLLDQQKVKQLAKHSNLVLVCGHYEGIDQRFIDEHVDEEISIGDYVLSGGESAALVLMDAVTRYVPDFLGNEDSVKCESFDMNGGKWLEFDQYTRPASDEVPPPLLSGNAKAIAEWSRENALVKTFCRRSDLIEKQNLTAVEEVILKRFVFEKNQLKKNQQK